MRKPTITKKKINQLSIFHTNLFADMLCLASLLMVDTARKIELLTNKEEKPNEWQFFSWWLISKPCLLGRFNL